jgi:phosphoserine phosphatase RsbU/P
VEQPTVSTSIQAQQPQLRLTDFLDLATLQEIQDGFATVANVRAVITDASGNVLTSPDITPKFLAKQQAIESQEAQVPEPQRVGAEYIAPIRVAGQQVGTLRMKTRSEPALDEEKAQKLAQKFNVDVQLVKQIVSGARGKTTRSPAVQFLFLMANAIARLCYQEYELRQRIAEMTTAAQISQMLFEASDVNAMMQRTTRMVTERLGVKACSIRLVDQKKDELVTTAVHNLSKQYIDKGKILFSHSMAEEPELWVGGMSFIADMTRDSRVQYPQSAASEGIVSMLSAAMKYQEQPVGVIRVYTAEHREFDAAEKALLKTIASAAAAATVNARLQEEAREAQLLEQQINMAAEVQQRMIPRKPPKLAGFDFGAVYVPCYQLGGDLYDFIALPYDNVAVVIADVSGKGVPASLIMAMVRAAIRAQADNLYYLNEVLRRVNDMLVRDTKVNEFVTLFYGVIDAKNRRMTYCNAGHMPALLLRNGQIRELGAGDEGSIVLGIVPDETFKQNFVDLQPGDRLMLYTDGVTDARTFEDEIYGRQRVVDSFSSAGGNPNFSGDQLAKAILWDVRKFIGMNRPTDDISLVAIKVES